MSQVYHLAQICKGFILVTSTQQSDSSASQESAICPLLVCGRHLAFGKIPPSCDVLLEVYSPFVDQGGVESEFCKAQSCPETIPHLFGPTYTLSSPLCILSFSESSGLSLHGAQGSLGGHSAPLQCGLLGGQVVGPA